MKAIGALAIAVVLVACAPEGVPVRQGLIDDVTARPTASRTARLTPSPTVQPTLPLCQRPRRPPCQLPCQLSCRRVRRPPTIYPTTARAGELQLRLSGLLHPPATS